MGNALAYFIVHSDERTFSLHRGLDRTCQVLRGAKERRNQVVREIAQGFDVLLGHE